MSFHLLSPSSGPSEGATLVRLSGANFHNGSDYRCRFGGHEVGVEHRTSFSPRASAGAPLSPSVAPSHHRGGIAPDSQTDLYCTTPPQPSAVGPMAAEVTLNGQQYTRDATPFMVYPPPRVARLSPASGPTAGATNVTILGGPFDIAPASMFSANGSSLSSSPESAWEAANYSLAQRLIGDLNISGPLTNGSDPRCRFGAVAGGGASGNDVPATVAAEVLNATALRCVTPTGTSRQVGISAVEITLNGQQYTRDATPFSFTASDLAVLSVSPVTGPEHGETLLTVVSTGIEHGAHYCCRLGGAEGGFVFNASYVARDAATLQTWGWTPGSRGNTTNAAASVLQCTTPDAKAPRGAEDFDAQTLTPPGATSGVAGGPRYGVPLVLSISTNCQQFAEDTTGTMVVVGGGGGGGGGGEVGSGSGSGSGEEGSGSGDIPGSGYFESGSGGGGDAAGGELVPLSSDYQLVGNKVVSTRFFSYFASPPRSSSSPDTIYGQPQRRVLSISPSSGPDEGDTNVTLSGGPFAGGSDYRCRYGETMVEATASDDGRSLHCQAPSAVGARAAVAPPAGWDAAAVARGAALAAKVALIDAAGKAADATSWHAAYDPDPTLVNGVVVSSMETGSIQTVAPGVAEAQVEVAMAAAAVAARAAADDLEAAIRDAGATAAGGGAAAVSVSAGWDRDSLDAAAAAAAAALETAVLDAAHEQATTYLEARARSSAPHARSHALLTPLIVALPPHSLTPHRLTPSSFSHLSSSHSLSSFPRPHLRYRTARG